MWAKQSTAATLIVGPILDSTGAEFTTAVIGDLSISKNGGTLTALAAAATLTHIANGQYTLVLRTTDVDTLGRLQISCNKATYQMPPVNLMVVPAMVFDSLVLGTDVLQGDVTQISGDTLAADNAEAFFDGTGYAGTNNVIPTVTNVTNGVTASTVSDKTGYSLTAGTGLGNQTSNITGNVSGSVGSVTAAVVLDSVVTTQITAIETFATRMTTGLVVDGAVYQFTANMLELGPSGGGGSSVNVLPATGIVADRSAGVTLTPVVGETISQSITMYRTDGTTAVNVSGKTLAIVFETLSGVDVATVASGNITISGASSNIVTFAYPSAVTASERTLRFAIRDAAAPLTMYLQGVCSVVAAPKVDA